MPAISAVFTLNHVATLLGEDEEWLFDLSINMFPEDGCLHVYGVGEDGVTAFTQYGIENLKQIIDDERQDGRAVPKPGSGAEANTTAGFTGCIPNSSARTS